MSQPVPQALAERLKKHDQSHLLAFWADLGPDEQDGLLAQIEKLNFAQIDTWIEKYIKNSDPPTVPTDFSPADYYPAVAAGDQQRAKYAEAVKLGKELIAAGKVAGFVVAGGQGTRLGFDGPKGNYPISPIKAKTLFQIFAENIAATQALYGAVCPWYVMTSPLNYQATKDIFEADNYYGLDPANVCIFQQGTLPNFTFDGHIILADKARIASSPDGHGGSLKALSDSGALSDMKARGAQYISYWQVDNPLINIFDPLFIGLHAMDKGGMSSKALKKTGPMEKVGNFCLVDGKVTVIEYSDLPDEQAHRVNDDGSLAFELGSIGIHVISTDFVEELNAGEFSLGFHKAVKKIPHVDADGNIVKPTEPNGVKLESFVFDALPLAEASIILQTDRSEEFGPVKNAQGVDSAETSRQMQIDRAAQWLKAAGIEVPTKADGTPDCVLEIAASFALDAEAIKAKADQVPPIKAGDELYLA
jgi:UDP-N-acetylglucosamine/UDP-N-acetylgalactosamine diphosphorylase